MTEVKYGFCYCGCGQKTALAKSTVPRLGLVKGEPVHYMTGHHMLGKFESIEVRFWNQVNKNGPIVYKHLGRCWLWTGSVCKRGGYGQLSADRRDTRTTHRVRKAHRISWEMEHKTSLSPKQWVCHHCDNPRCVRPSHLFLGDRKANMEDAVRKHRMPYGEGHHATTITTKTVIAMRKAYDEGMSAPMIARKFRVLRQTTGNIVRRKAWKYAP